MTLAPNPYTTPASQKAYRSHELRKAKAFCREARHRRLQGDIRGAARVLGLAMVSRRVATLKFS
jgi:hypothetical protein